MQNIINNFEALSEKDFSEYAGEWVAVLDGKIIAHSKNFKEVYNLAKKNFPKERPLIGKLPENIPVVLSIC